MRRARGVGMVVVVAVALGLAAIFAGRAVPTGSAEVAPSTADAVADTERPSASEARPGDGPAVPPAVPAVPTRAGEPNPSAPAPGVAPPAIGTEGGGATAPGSPPIPSGDRATSAPTAASPEGPRGSLHPDEIRHVVRQALPELRFCFEWQLDLHPELGGRLTMELTIAEDGSVAEAHVAEDALEDPVVSRCFTHVIERMQFPPPDPPGEVMVRYPFVLAGAPPARAPEGI